MARRKVATMVQTEEGQHLSAAEAKQLYETARQKDRLLMSALAIALRQGRGISWLKKENEQILFGMGVLVLDDAGNLQVRPELMPHFCPLQYRCEEGEAPVSGKGSIYMSEDDFPPDEILEFRRLKTKGTPMVKPN